MGRRANGVTTVLNDDGALPPLYARWMRTWLEGPIPHEPEATCDDCAMLAPDVAPLAQAEYFHPSTKCCTYVPTLPNFLVGRLLNGADPVSAFGMNSLQQRIATGVGVTPLGLAQPPTFALLYRHTREAAFGRSPSMRCPHYDPDGGRCGIWKHRPSVCTTWFCKHERGAVGRRFWMSVHQLLTEVETRLSRWCVLELDPGDEAIERLMATVGLPVNPRPPVLDDMTAARTDAAMWGRWRGRELDFFRACANLVEPLPWSDVAAIAGVDARAFAGVARRAYHALNDLSLPPRLTVAPFKVLALEPERCVVIGYSGQDPLDLPPELMAALPSFDGRPTDIVLRDIEATHHVRLEPALVRRLLDFGLLSDASSSLVSL